MARDTTSAADAVKGEKVSDFVSRIVAEGRGPRAAEHLALMKDSPSITEFARSANRERNRYANVLLFDETRLRLAKTRPGDTDYIHASKLIDGSYILTQGPLSETVGEFWRMVWQEKIQLMVLLCTPEEADSETTQNGYFPYWPAIGKVEKIYGGRFEVKGESVEKHKSKEENITVTEMRLWSREGGKKDARRLIQIQFQSWPDALLPKPRPILDLMEAMWEHEASLDALRAKETPTNFNPRSPSPSTPRAPTLIICDNGGRSFRSGMLAALSLVCREYRQTGFCRVQETVSQIRRDRYGSFEKKSTYAWLYQALVEYAYSKNELDKKEPAVAEFLNLLRKDPPPKP